MAEGRDLEVQGERDVAWDAWPDPGLMRRGEVARLSEKYYHTVTDLQPMSIPREVSYVGRSHLSFVQCRRDQATQ